MNLAERIRVITATSPAKGTPQLDRSNHIRADKFARLEERRAPSRISELQVELEAMQKHRDHLEAQLALAIDHPRCPHQRSGEIYAGRLSRA